MKSLAFFAAAGLASAVISTSCFAQDDNLPEFDRLLELQTVQVGGSDGTTVHLATTMRADGSTCKQFDANVDRSPSGVSVTMGQHCVAASGSSRSLTPAKQ